MPGEKPACIVLTHNAENFINRPIKTLLFNRPLTQNISNIQILFFSQTEKSSVSIGQIFIIPLTANPLLHLSSTKYFTHKKEIRNSNIIFSLKLWQYSFYFELTRPQTTVYLPRLFLLSQLTLR